MIRLVSTQGQVYAIYFNDSSDYGTVSHTLLLPKPSFFGPTSAYVSCYRSYLTDYRVLRFLVFLRRPLDFFLLLLKIPY